MASQARPQQPPWQSPPNAVGKSLHIYNSLTRSKTPFAPLDPLGKTVTWYACGPTVYDDAHVGHARNYVSTDILRRIMRDYFKFDVKFVMNITDVDDKIIIRARQHYLFDEFIDPKRRRGTATVEETSVAAFETYLAKNLKLIPRTVAPEELPGQVQKHYGDVLNGKALQEAKISRDEEEKTKMHIGTVRAAADAMRTLKGTSSATEDERFLGNVRDVIMPYLDSLYGSTFGASDHTISTKWAKKFEDRFMEDMQALNVLEPDVVTRVTEYVEKIIAFITQIRQRGFAYETSDKSVYFDIKAFEDARNSYARLEPWSRNNTDLQADGEGALTKKSTEKRSSADFALWKSSKEGEPSWESPWGLGRPGWHIECSAMASHKLGNQMDIHSGGIDLAFPHHDNELAQSEAYWCDQHYGGQHQWVNYFIHMGHLSIQGAKMSKSLKNFITIRQELSREGGLDSRAMRIIFLLGGWKDGIEITEMLRKEASAWEDKMNNFFIKVLNMNDTQAVNGSAKTVKASDQTPLARAKDKFHVALTDSFNTPLAMRVMSELVSEYISLEGSLVVSEQTMEVAHWLTQMVNMFGLNGAAQVDSQSIGWSGVHIPDYAKPFLTLISKVRDHIRQQAQTGKSVVVQDVTDVRDALQNHPLPNTEETAPYQTALNSVLSLMTEIRGTGRTKEFLMSFADRIRDQDLWDLGIYLEDQPSSPVALIRPVTRELREVKIAEQAKKAKKSHGSVLSQGAAAPAAKEDKRAVDPCEMFRTDEYSAWDDDGLPIKDSAGNELTKSKSKKLKKQWDHQKRLYDGWQAQHQQRQAS
ncbi:MAG: hypothetical protein Q9178_007696 [Gyalolechia marmorata]